jgi:3-deoxy-7-phosphoheptulonate synthase
MFTYDTAGLNQDTFLFIAGPCALESKEQMESFLEKAPNSVVRAGIYKMRTNPNSFQGLREEGIEIIKELKKINDFKFVTEITDPRHVEALLPVCDYFQVGSRNMYNYELLKELNKYDKPVILKRAFSATVKEWINAAEYMKDLSPDQVYLCERGIRTFETSTRNTLDINSVVYLKQHTPFKVLVDPSHACGDAKMIRPLCHVAVASGADGILVESHPNPSQALSDKEQAIDLDELLTIHKELQKLCDLYGKKMM